MRDPHRSDYRNRWAAARAIWRRSRRDLLMIKRCVKPIFVGRDGGSDRTKEQRIVVAPRVISRPRQHRSDLDSTFALDQNDLGKARLVRNDLQPGDGEPPASARFRSLGVAKYSSFSRKVSELPTSTMSGNGSCRYRFNVISVPSRVVVDGSCRPLPNRAVASRRQAAATRRRSRILQPVNGRHRFLLALRTENR